MTGFDYDVLIIGSGFGGSVATLRAAEKGYRVGVMESGRRWKDEDIPKTQWDLPGFLWFPGAELYGIQRIEYLDDVLVLCGAGVGGGSHVYVNTLYVPPRKFFDAPEWAGITGWAGELAPYIDQASRMLGVVRSTVAVLVQDAATKALTPELIRVAGGGNQPKIFGRHGPTTPAAWLYALQAAKVSVTVYGIWLGHVYQWHLVTAAMLMTMFQTLPAGNPARRLFEPQSSFLIPFDDVLLQWSAAAPPTSIATGRQFLELIDRFAADRRFFDDDPRTQLERPGVTESDFTVSEPWDQFPVVGDLLAIWDATARCVDTYVDHAYPADRDVQHDRQLERWITKSGDIDGGNVRGLPAMDSKDALKRVLHSLIYRITAHGTSRLYRSANPVLTFVANFPPCLQDATIPDPTDSFDTPALHRFLPNTGTIGSMLHFYFIFWATPPYVPFVPLEGTDADLFFDDDVSNEALIELRRFVIDFVETHEPGTPRSGSGNGTSSFEAEEQCDDRTYRWQ